MDFSLGGTATGGFVGAFGPFNHVHSPHLYRVSLFGVVGGEGEGVLNSTIHTGVAMMYGRTTAWRLGRASVATGLSVGGYSPPFRETGGQFVVGLPVEATVHFAPPRYAVLGLEVGLHANLNPVQSYAGIIVGVAVGDLR
jgi:hypothetical protein